MSVLWSVEGGIARLHIGKLSGQLDLRRPEQGLHEVKFNDTSVEKSHFLAVVLPSPNRFEAILDCYVRANDLIVTYAESGVGKIRLQLYWRAIHFPDDSPQAFGVDVIVSAQTSKLYSDPTLLVGSRMSVMPESRAINPSGDAGPVAIRLNPSCSYSQSIHPSDFNTVKIRVNGGIGEIEHQLFAPGLEKGVIRRARIRGLFVGGEQVSEVIAASDAQFISQELPLTT